MKIGQRPFVPQTEEWVQKRPEGHILPPDARFPGLPQGIQHSSPLWQWAGMCRVKCFCIDRYKEPVS